MQEAIDRLATLKQRDNQIDQLQIENARLRHFEANFENVQVNLRTDKCTRTCIFVVVVIRNTHMEPSRGKKQNLNRNRHKPKRA